MGITSWILVGGLAASPVLELRGSIPYGLAIGLNPWGVLLLSIAVNALVAPLLFLIFRKAHMMELAHRFFGKRIHRLIEKTKKKFEVWEELALLVFVAIPLPGTGAWTASIVAELLDLDRIKSSFVIAAGVAAAGLIVFFGIEGIIQLLHLLGI